MPNFHYNKTLFRKSLKKVYYYLKIEHCTQIIIPSIILISNNIKYCIDIETEN